VDINPANTITPATYIDVFELLERYSVRYVVVSGMAVVLHGHVRPLYDLDIVIAATPEEQNRALQVLMLAGFVPTIPIPLQLATVLRLFDQERRELDVFARYHIPFAELWEDSVQIRNGATIARVVSLAHLIRAKRITGRPHDLEDVAGLLTLSS
jgi:hypothetical protein